MTKNSSLNTIKQLFKHPLFTVPFIGALSGVFLYTVNNTDIAILFIAAIVAFIVSDLLTPVLIRGGKGICQIRGHGNLTVPEGYGFIAFFIIILALSFGLEYLSKKVGEFLLNFNGLLPSLAIGLVLACGVYFDLFVKFYKRPKKQ